MSDFVGICCICIKKYAYLETIDDVDEKQIKYVDKLKVCVPDEVWHLDYEICKNCIELLDPAYDFMRICSKHQKVRQDLYEKQKEYESKHPFPCNSCDKSFRSEQYLKAHITKTHSVSVPIFSDKYVPTKKELDLANFCETELYNNTAEFDEKDVALKTQLEEVPVLNEEPESQYFDDKDDNDENDNDNTILDNDYMDHDDEDDFTSSSDSDDSFKPLNQLKKVRKKRQLREKKVKEPKQPKPKKEKKVKEKKEKVRKEKVKKEKRPLRRAPFKCEYCNEEFKKTQFLVNHVRSRHTFEKPFACDQCEARYRNASSLTIHKRSHTDERPYICTECGKAFRSSQDLGVHTRTHGSVNGYPCPHCDKGFKTHSNLRMHRLRMHVAPQDYKYPCNLCEKRFPFKTNLMNHLKRHAGIKNHPCHICGKKFVLNHDLVIHIATHRDEKLYKCDLCEKDYKNRAGWRKHMKTAHDLGTWKPPTKRHLCPICPKIFYYNNKLQRHLLTHTGEKPFKCNYCIKCFREQHSLKVHVKNEHNIDWDDMQNL